MLRVFPFHLFSKTFIAAVVFLMGCASVPQAAEVAPGVEVLVNHYADDLKGKRVGILTNPTGVDRQLRSTIDLVNALPDVNVVRLFAPEHGLRGGFYAGDKVDETRDPFSGLPIASLYGNSRRPTPEMLSDLDVVLYDIQDVGVRHYTFISSLAYMMQECEKVGVEVWVLDRPEPMGGRLASGPMMENDFISFIGIYTIPKVYGMTPGEFARMYQAERTPKLKLRVIPMQGWKRGMTYADLGWVWVSPSQHIPRWETCYYYAMTGVIGELGIFNVGVGTPLPFEQIGMPGLDGIKLAAVLNARKIPGVVFRPTTFSPKYAVYTGKECQGVQIHITDYSRVNAEHVCLELMDALMRLAPSGNPYKKAVGEGSGSMYMKALGDGSLGKALAEGRGSAGEIDRINQTLREFNARRAKYLIYE